MRACVIVGATLALAISPAMAGGKSGGGHSATQDHPQESISLNYGKVEHTYTQQKSSQTGQATGKRIHKPIFVTKKTDASSPK
jgi:type VI protein secretion system component Hcp